MKQETIFGYPLKQLQQEAGEIFSTHAVGEKVRDKAIKSKFKMIYDRHPLKRKVRGNFDLIVVKDKLNIRKCFAIATPDGLIVRFSLEHALKKQNKNLRKYFLEVCRDIVHKDVLFKKKELIRVKGCKCEESGEFFPENQLHLHHKSPFEFNVICEGFLTQNGIKLESSLFDLNDRGDITFKDKSLLNDFKIYHKKYLDKYSCLLFGKLNKSKGTRYRFSKVGKFARISVSPAEVNKHIPRQLDLFK